MFFSARNTPVPNIPDALHVKYLCLFTLQPGMDIQRMSDSASVEHLLITRCRVFLQGAGLEPNRGFTI